MRKLTTQEFIDRARAAHGDKYGYAFSVYQGNGINLMVHCPDHGIFEQSPNNHLRGNHCPICTNEKKKTGRELFIEKAKLIHGNDKYNYLLVNYVNARENVVVICSEHGLFSQTPYSHLTGVGCPSCYGNRRHTNSSFIEKAKETHGDKYNYSLVNYKNSISKIKIICQDHGEFEQTPTCHPSGQGCVGCAKNGFDRTKVGFLYVLRSDCGQYMKIGITNNPDQRHAQLSRETPFTFECIELIEDGCESIANLEKELLSEYTPVEFYSRFDGYTEWRLFNDSIRNKLLTSKL